MFSFGYSDILCIRAMTKSISDLCAYLAITNNNICLAYTREALQYCFKFRKQFSSTSSFFYRNALQKMMIWDTGYICYRENYSKYWHMHPTHLTLGECNSIMNKYGASEEQIMVDKILVDQYEIALKMLVIHSCVFAVLILSMVLLCCRNVYIMERCKDLQFPIKKIYQRITVRDGKPFAIHTGTSGVVIPKYRKRHWCYINPSVEMRRLHIKVVPSIEELCFIKKMPTLVVHLPIRENVHMVEAYKWTGLGVVHSLFKCNRFHMSVDALKDATASFGQIVAVIDTIITFDKDFVEYYVGEKESEDKQKRKIMFDLGQRSQIPRRAHTTGSILRKPMLSALRRRLSPNTQESRDVKVVQKEILPVVVTNNQRGFPQVINTQKDADPETHISMTWNSPAKNHLWAKGSFDNLLIPTFANIKTSVPRKQQSVNTDNKAAYSQWSACNKLTSHTIPSPRFARKRTTSPMRKTKPVVAQTITSMLRSAKLYENKAKSSDNIKHTSNTAIWTRSKSTETLHSPKRNPYSQMLSRVDSNLSK